jgi:HEAT repeat protein
MRRVILSVLVVAASLWAAGPVLAQPEKREIDEKKGKEVFNGKTLFEWTEDLKNPDPGVRERAIANLKFYGREAYIAVPHILKALKDPDVSLRVNAVIALGFIGMDQKDRTDGVRAIVELLRRDPEGIVRFQAARTLGRLASAVQMTYSDCNTAVPILVMRLKDTSSWEIRAAAAFALGSVGWDPNGPDPRAVTALIMALRTKESCAEVRVQELVSLVIYGAAVNNQAKAAEQAALLDLTKSRQDPRQAQAESVVIWAHMAFLRLTSGSSQEHNEEHLQGISKFLKSKKVDVREHAARAMATLGLFNPPILANSRIDDMIEALDNPKEVGNVQIWLLTALGKFGTDAKRALPQVEKLTHNSDQVVKKAAEQARDDINNVKVRKDDLTAPKKKTQ